eukprot:7457142-Pyramimonas_sp.AAC.1
MQNKHKLLEVRADFLNPRSTFLSRRAERAIGGANGPSADPRNPRGTSTAHVDAVGSDSTS